MRSIHMSLITIAALSLPGLALAEGARCALSAPRDLNLELAGVRSVVFDTNNHDLHLTGTDNNSGQLTGRACAANESALASLTISQEKQGDVLTVTLKQQDNRGWSFGKKYAYLELTGTLPATSKVRVNAGSGDIEINNVATLALKVGSGDVNIRQVRGSVSGSIGSGDLTLREIGSLELGTIGSGDLKATDIRGNASLNSIGSGDLTLIQVQDNVQIGTVGSGDVTVTDIGGSLTVGSIGSGDVEARRIGGDVTVRSKGHGDIRTHDVKGTVNQPQH